MVFALLEYFSVTRFTLGSPCRKVAVTRESWGKSTPSDSSQQAGVFKGQGKAWKGKHFESNRLLFRLLYIIKTGGGP